MKTITQRVTEFFQGLIPVSRRTIFDTRQQRTGLASSATVEMVHGILERADSGDPSDLFALYQEIVLADAHLQSEFAKRKLAVLGDPVSIVAAKKGEAQADAAAQWALEQLQGADGWLDACKHLLDSCLWPVAVVEKVFARAAGGFVLKSLVPVPDALLDFSAGRLRIRVTTEAGLPTGQFAEVEPGRYMVHRGHLLSSPDHRGGPLRSLVWWWLLSTMDREWWVRFLDRYGAPFLVGKYDQADDASRSVLQSAFSYATKIGGLVVSKETEVEIQQAATSGAGEAFAKFLEIAQREKSKLVIGQTLSGDTQAQGIGGGATALHGQVREDIRQWDAFQLAATIQRQLVAQLLEINGIAVKIRVAWGTGNVSLEAAQAGPLLQALAQAGIELTDAGLERFSEQIQLPLQRAKALPIARNPTLLSAGGEISADLAREFSGALAPVRQAIITSNSLAELEASLGSMFSDWPAERVAALMQRATQSFLSIS